MQYICSIGNGIQLEHNPRTCSNTGKPGAQYREHQYGRYDNFIRRNGNDISQEDYTVQTKYQGERIGPLDEMFCQAQIANMDICHQPDYHSGRNGKDHGTRENDYSPVDQ